MNQVTLGLAHKLLNKAQSIDFDAEATALTERAYRLLAEALNDYEGKVPAAGTARKRERRHLFDRRSNAAASNSSMAAGTPKPTEAHARRAEWIGSPSWGSQVDLRV